MSEVAQAFSKAKSVGGNRMRFEIAGGDYRLIAAFDFRRQIAYVKFVGTHAEYDRIDAATVAQF
jgi:mRNA interferase HigB